MVSLKLHCEIRHKLHRSLTDSRKIRQCGAYFFFFSLSTQVRWNIKTCRLIDLWKKMLSMCLIYHENNSLKKAPMNMIRLQFEIKLRRQITGLISGISYFRANQCVQMVITSSTATDGTGTLRKVFIYFTISLPDCVHCSSRRGGGFSMLTWLSGEEVPCGV